MRDALRVALAGLVAVLPLANPLASHIHELTVASDPQGAGVYVDGRFAGQTPVSVPKLTAGGHRLRLVKDGYLERVHLVRVGTAPVSVHLRLTPHAPPEAGARQVEVAGNGGVERRSKLPWIVAGLAGVGAGGYLVAKPSPASQVVSGSPSGGPPSTSPPGPGNNPPVAGAVAATPSTGLAASTAVRFSAVGASDPDGDPLTFDWDFADGSPHSASANPTHVFTTAGTFAVTVTVSDGNASASASGTVVTKRLSGTWTGPLVGEGTTYNTTVTLDQSGASLSGTYTDGLLSTGTVGGLVATNSPTVTFTVTGLLTQFTFTGNASADVNTLTGVANGSGFTNAPWTLTRQ